MNRTALRPALRRPLAAEIARSLGLEPRILPLAPELLSEVGELSGSPRHILQALNLLGLPPGSRVLDLGCGKGVLAVRLAEQFDFDVTGVDAFEPFVAEARRRAAENGVCDHCHFQCGDARAVLQENAEIDLALMIGLEPALGSVGGRVAGVRRRVRPGGYLVLDGRVTEHGREEAIAGMTAHGDELLHEIVAPRAETAHYRLLIVRSVRRRAELLEEQYPRQAGALRRYVESLERTALDGEGLSYAIWVLRRSP